MDDTSPQKPPTASSDAFETVPPDPQSDAVIRRSWFSDDTASMPHSALGAPLKLEGVPGYEILGELGRGGMGVVYKARQLGPNRPCALKMILAGAHAGAAELSRFRTEAEAIGRLQHPNIVQIFEVGEHDALPFLSLEFCAGGSLEKKLDGTPLPPDEAARLVETLARAMQAAHQANVIHRDLKPANVLLATACRFALAESDEANAKRQAGARDGIVPKITDFGLARKLDEAGQTTGNAIVGTPAYMSPEQAAGKSSELGPATDVYALGAILYECLTGRPPFKAATVIDTLHQVVGNEPVPPSQLQPRTPRDLETITLKCLQKDPGRRYATAADLADDLHRFLAGEPITARPVGGLEKAWKWVKRNPVVAALSAVIVLLLVGSSLGIYAKYLDAWQRKREADEMRIAAEQREQEADRLRQAAEQFSLKARRTLDEAGKDDEKTRQVPGAQMLRRELMQSTLRFYKDLAAYYPDDRSLREKVADTHLRLAVATGRFRPIKEALPSFREATRIFEELIAQEPNNLDPQVRLAEAHLEMGRLALEREDPSRAEELLLKARQMVGPILDKDSGHRQALLCLGGVYHRLGAARSQLGRKDKPTPIDCGRDSLKQFDKVLNRSPGNVDALLGAGVAHNLLQYNFSAERKRDEQRRHSEESLRLFERASKLAPGRLDIVYQRSNALRNKALRLRDAGQLKEGIRALEEAIALGEQLIPKSPDVPIYKQFLAGYQHHLADMHESNTADAERFVKAARAYDQAVQMYGQLEAQDRTNPAYPRERIKALLDLADMEKIRGRLEVARDVLDRALQAAAPAARAIPDNVDLVYYVARTNYLRGKLDADNNQPATALPFLRSAVDVYQSRLLRMKLTNRGGYLDEYLEILDIGHQAARAANLPAEVIRYGELALPVGPELVNRQAKVRWCTVLNNLAQQYTHLGKTDDAVAILNKVLATGRPIFDRVPWHYYLRHNLRNACEQLAAIHEARGEIKEEILLRRQILKLRERIDGADYSTYTASSNPLTIDEAKRLRGVWLRMEMKKFNIPATQNGRPAPTAIYITQHVPKVMLDPLEDQARTLKEDHNIIVPQNVRDGFRQLYKAAMEYKVSYQDLCSYALSSRTPGDIVRQARVKEAIDRFARESAELKTRLRDDSSNHKLRRRLALLYLDLAVAHLANQEEKGAVQAWEQARQVLEHFSPDTATDPARTALLAEVYHNLGEYRRHTGEYDIAHALLRRGADLLQHLERFAGPGEYRKALAMSWCSLADVEAARGETAEMLAWLMRAAWSKDEASLEILRNVIRVQPHLASRIQEALATACRSLPGAPEVPDWLRQRYPDLLTTIPVLVQTQTATNPRSWTYLAVKPSRATAFLKARQSATFQPAEFGVVLAAGPGKVPSGDVTERMKRQYGLTDDSEQRLRKVAAAREQARFTLPVQGVRLEGSLFQPPAIRQLLAADLSPPVKQMTPDNKVDLNKQIVLLLYGENARGEKIYVYLKLTLGNMERMSTAMLINKTFSPTDFGIVIAAGKGEPSQKVKDEIGKKYEKFFEESQGGKQPAAPKEKKP
jgi:serine/threonine protein kinase/tetratricopeptide (TPR) repeat protein